MVAVLGSALCTTPDCLHRELDALGTRDAKDGSDAGEDGDKLCNFDSIDKTFPVLQRTPLWKAPPSGFRYEYGIRDKMRGPKQPGTKVERAHHCRVCAGQNMYTCSMMNQSYSFRRFPQTFGSADCYLTAAYCVRYLHLTVSPLLAVSSCETATSFVSPESTVCERLPLSVGKKRPNSWVLLR
jgi:hypothetical protein